jgi:two-component system, OmpR family, response regulator CpxR
MQIRVLLIDDEREFVDTLGDRLETRDFIIYQAYDGAQGLETLRHTEIDVVVLDVLMPGMNGIEVLREVKKINPLTEVIMLTGHSTIESAIEGLKLGAFDYLMKPSDTKDLIGKILKAFSRKSEQQEKINQAASGKDM